MPRDNQEDLDGDGRKMGRMTAWTGQIWHGTETRGGPL